MNDNFSVNAQLEEECVQPFGSSISRIFWVDEVSNYWFEAAFGDPAIDQLEVLLKQPNRSQKSLPGTLYPFSKQFVEWCIPNSKWYTLCPRTNSGGLTSAFLEMNEPFPSETRPLTNYKSRLIHPTDPRSLCLES